MSVVRRSLKDLLPGEPPEVLARRPSRAKRNRSWEAEQRRKHGVVTYRGIGPELNEEIKTVAGELGVTTGEVARALLEYGMALYRSGKLSLEVVDGKVMVATEK